MGADLITYISVGPKTIEADAQEMEEIVEKARTVQESAEEHANRLIVHGETSMDETPLPANRAAQSVSIPFDPNGDTDRLNEIESREEIEAAEDPERLRNKALIFSGLGEFTEVLGKDRDAIEEAIEKFIETWNGEIPWRNVTYRIMPGDDGRKIVVAGERSWGDEPQGAYQVLKKAFAMGIAQHFGCQ